MYCIQLSELIVNLCYFLLHNIPMCTCPAVGFWWPLSSRKACTLSYASYLTSIPITFLQANAYRDLNNWTFWEIHLLGFLLSVGRLTRLSCFNVKYVGKASKLISLALFNLYTDIFNPLAEFYVSLISSIYRFCDLYIILMSLFYLI